MGIPQGQTRLKQYENMRGYSAECPFDPGGDIHTGFSAFQVLVQPREMVLNEVHSVFAPIQLAFDDDRWSAKHTPFASEIC